MAGTKLPLAEVPTARTIDYPSSRCVIYQSTGLNEVKWKQKLSKIREINTDLLHCWSPCSERWGWPPDPPREGTGIMALWKCIRGEKSRLQAAAGNSVSGDLWAEVSRNPVRSLLNGRAVLARRSLFPPSSPAWARWAGARTFWCLSLIYLFDEK